ncbi:MAG: DegT/DnrJ/EryC1/StrS family aminotransferase, partial [Stackebrandtia sp.]
MTLPFFPPDLFDAERETLRQTVYAVGTDPGQRFILSGHTARLEAALAEQLGGAEVIACGSGTSGLSLILTAVAVGPGDEVVV